MLYISNGCLFVHLIGLQPCTNLSALPFVVHLGFHEFLSR
uniref:Uncharacterized protein n=1 Tax=Arundo donax TaxID=35708 RepID=A0A0A9AP45_ARUDO